MTMLLRLGVASRRPWPSGEVEYYGMVEGCSTAIGVRSMLADIGVDVEIRFRTDAFAAKGIVSRRGLSKIRHSEVHQLWLQEKVYRGYEG